MRLQRGGHDPKKVYNAYKAAVENNGSPTVILAHTIKGYGLGEAGEGRNITHQQKKLNEAGDRAFPLALRDSDPGRSRAQRFVLPSARRQPGDGLPARAPPPPGRLHAQPQRAAPRKVQAPPLDSLAESLAGSQGREVSTTMAFVRVLTLLLKNPELGKRVVPIIPDEARTFGMESLFRQFGIYASKGQLYKPHDAEMFLYYKESKDGQILEEGITEAGSMASFTAAGTAYANYGVEMIPFFIYYSMFGFQRVGDLIWAFADARGKGFLMGGTAGRTTLSGEGLAAPGRPQPRARQHRAHLRDLRSGLRVRDRRHRAGWHPPHVPGTGRPFYYLTLYNENYPMPPMPEGVTGGHSQRHLSLQGRRRKGKAEGAAFRQRPDPERGAARAEDPGREVQRAGRRVERDQLQRAAPRSSARWSAGTACIPAEPARQPYIQQALTGAEGPIVAATDYMKVVADQIAPWLPGRMETLGTDGFGRSDNREYLRRHFEINAESIAAAALSRLARDGKFPMERATAAFGELGVNTEKVDPARA